MNWDEALERTDTMHKVASELCRTMIERTLELELHPKMGILALYHVMHHQVLENLRRGNFSIEDIRLSKKAFDIIAAGHLPIEYEASPEDGIVEIIKH